MTTPVWRAALAACMLTFGVASVSLTAEAKGKWVCMKDGKKVKAKGKNPKARQKSCESKGGTWQEHAAAAPAEVTEPAEPMAPPADAGGGGGGW